MVLMKKNPKKHQMPFARNHFLPVVGLRYQF